MSILTFLGKKAAGGPLDPVPGPLGGGSTPKAPAAPTAPQAPIDPNLPPGGAPPKVPGSNNPAQRLDEFLWLTGMSPNKPGHLGQPAAPAAAAGGGGGAPLPPGVHPPKPQGSLMANLAAGIPGDAAMFGPAAAAWPLPQIASKLAPGLAARFGSSAPGQFLGGPGAAGNAFNLARSMSPWATGGAAPASVAGLGSTGTAGAALYGAYTLGDIPFAGLQAGLGHWSPKTRTNEQAARMQGHGALGNAGGYLHNLGENLLRPGKSYLNYVSDMAGTAKDLYHFGRRGLTGSRF